MALFVALPAAPPRDRAGVACGLPGRCARGAAPPARPGKPTGASRPAGRSGLAAAATAAWLGRSSWRRRREAARPLRRAAADAGFEVTKIVTREAPEGAAQLKYGDHVKVHYVGKLEDGTVFDSSRERADGFSFTLGAGDVIVGWDKGVVQMRVGEVSRILVPPDLAYGAAGVPPLIPPNAALDFEVEVLSVSKKAPPRFDPEVGPIDDDLGGLDEELSEAANRMLEESLEEEEPMWARDPERESGKGRGYTWAASKTGAEICVDVPVPSELSSREVSVDFGMQRLKIAVAGKTVISGSLTKQVDMEECHWVLDDKGGLRRLLVYLVKLDSYQVWPDLIEESDDLDDEDDEDDEEYQ